VLVLATGVAYWPALQAGFVWDDDDYVTENAALRTPAGLARIWLEPGAVPQYYPLTFTSLWLDYQRWGTDPRGYHATNVALHVVAALLLWRVLVCLAVPGAWLAAAIFALHPVHVESVAWISERKNVLSGVLAIAAVLAYLRFAGVGGVPAFARARCGAYVLALLSFAAALLAKTVTCTVPVVLLLLLWWRRGRLERADGVAVLPMLALGVALGLVTVWMEQQHVGARGVHWALSPVERVLIAGRALWFYGATLVWPRALTFVYPRWAVDATVWWQSLFPLAAVAVAGALALMRARLGRGPLVALASFAVMLAPALGFIDVYPMRYTFVADHYQYLASTALIALGVAACAGVAARLGRPGRPVAAVAAAIVLGVLGVLTWRQGGIYADQETLWRDTLAKNPSAAMAHVNLGMLLYERGQSDAAVAQFEAALALDPGDAEVHDNLGIARAARGEREAARAHFEAALRLAPGAARTYSNLGNLLAQEGRFDEAMAAYREAVRLRPAYADARNNLANVLAARGLVAEAVEQYREAVRLDPTYATARYNLGVVLAGEGQTDEALAQYAEAVRLRPTYAEARRALALALARAGRLTEALPHFAAVVRVRPDATGHRELGGALAAAGRTAEAIAEYERALALAPAQPDVHNELGVVYARSGRSADAAGHFREALRLAPDHAGARTNLAALAGAAADTPE
jgi:tetratricopeptide (TPR) repeat protein